MLHPNAQAWPVVIESQIEEVGIDLRLDTKMVECLRDTSGRVIGAKANPSVSHPR